MNNIDVVALGELLIDFTHNGESEQGNPVFEANPGGAPCNVLSMLSKLGHKVAFIGKVGDDIFGKQLREAIDEVGIDSTGLCVDKDVHTTLAFVQTFPGGDRDFSFYRNPGADMMLTKDDINEELIKSAKIFHFGTLSMTDEPCREATKKAIDIAKENGKIISFDPNLREPLWKDLSEAKEQAAYGMSKCDILKISDNEVVWFTGETDYDKGIEKIRSEYSNIKLLLFSMGKDGSKAYAGDEQAFVPAFVRDDTVETTGAGDTFGACSIHYVLEHGLENLTEENLKELLRFSNAAASIVTTRKGALRVMPSEEEVWQLLKM